MRRGPRSREFLQKLHVHQHLPCRKKSRSSLRFPNSSLEMDNRYAFVVFRCRIILNHDKFITRCTKPSKKGRDSCFHSSYTGDSQFRTEYLQICRAVAVGFAVMGFIGYFVKLIHIPMCVATIFCYVFANGLFLLSSRNNILV